MNLVIQKTKECSDQLELLQTSPEEYDRTKNLLTSKSEQLSAICANTTLTNYTLHLNDPQRQQKQENAMQRTTGYDTTVEMQGHVQYTKLGTRHISFVCQEILECSGTYNPQEKIRKLTRTLLELETEIQRKQIKERTKNKCPSDKMLKMKTFCPQCHLANEYKIN